MNTSKLPIPNLSANLNDESATDSSIAQEHVTINASNGATINSNSGNSGSGKEITRVFAMITTILFSIICDIALGWLVYTQQQNIVSEFGKVIDNSTRRLDNIGQEQKSTLDEALKDMEQTAKKFADQSREGSIWILRKDMFRQMDFHEVTKTITAKQHKALKDEFEYYKSLGGNHDVQDRMDLFNAKIFGTGEIKMVPSQK